MASADAVRQPRALAAHVGRNRAALRRGSFIPVNIYAYFGIDGRSAAFGLRTSSAGRISTDPSFYEVRFPFPVNATSVTVQNASANNTGFLARHAHLLQRLQHAGHTQRERRRHDLFPEQQNVTWIRLTASSISTIRPGGASVSEFIVAGSYVEPQFRINEGTGRTRQQQSGFRLRRRPATRRSTSRPRSTPRPSLPRAPAQPTAIRCRPLIRTTTRSPSRSSPLRPA